MLEASLLKKVSAKLDRLLQPVCKVCDKARQRFVQETVAGILVSGSLVVTDLARHLAKNQIYYRLTVGLRCLLAPPPASLHVLFRRLQNG